MPAERGREDSGGREPRAGRARHPAQRHRVNLRSYSFPRRQPSRSGRKLAASRRSSIGCPVGTEPLPIHRPPRHLTPTSPQIPTAPAPPPPPALARTPQSASSPAPRPRARHSTPHTPLAPPSPFPCTRHPATHPPSPGARTGTRAQQRHRRPTRGSTRRPPVGRGGGTSAPRGPTGGATRGRASSAPQRHALHPPVVQLLCLLPPPVAEPQQHARPLARRQQGELEPVQVVRIVLPHPRGFEAGAVGLEGGEGG
ncbi:hypothetical protein DFJ74DRAFT_76670 [Hyaloraphidium curvatum]|nr:hypothetical protein DFJ74DRAFT_76670 [Hyaloraphidium curvatum]